MALIILEGLDRTGKSSVAEHYKAQGYEIVHQSAPPKGQTPDLYLEEQMQLVSSAAHKDIVLDRSYYGELVWPTVYNRPPLISEEGLEVLRELEESVGTTRILMYDPNTDAHWKRCVDNKEPLTREQFLRARNLFNSIAKSWGFEKKTLADFAISTNSDQDPKHASPESPAPSKDRESPPRAHPPTKEQIKLETANAINDVLSKRILKHKGPIFDQLEDDIRTFLNNKLGQIFGTKSPSGFTDEEVELLKFFANKLKDGKR